MLNNTLFFILAASIGHNARPGVRNGQLPLQQTRLLLVPKLRGGADPLQTLLARGGAMRTQRMSSTQTETLKTLPALLWHRGNNSSEYM